MNEDGKSDGVEIGEIWVRPRFNFDIKRVYLNSSDESKKVFLSSGWYMVFERENFNQKYSNKNSLSQWNHSNNTRTHQVRHRRHGSIKIQQTWRGTT